MRALLLLLAFVGLVSCGPAVNCAEEALNPPSEPPSKRTLSTVYFQVGMEREDLHAVCRMSGHYLGGCDPDCGSLAWFCADEHLYAIDCSEIFMHGRCHENETTWFCEKDEPFVEFDDCE